MANYAAGGQGTAAFNPGSTGGYLRHHQKHRQSGAVKRKVFSKSEKKELIATVHRARPWDVVAHTYHQTVSTVQTSDAYPATLVAAPLVGYVGWNEIEALTEATVAATINSGFRSDAYVTSGTTITRAVPFIEENRDMKIKWDLDLLFKNQTTVSTRIDLYLLQCNEDGSTSALAELLERYTNSAVLNTGGGVVAGTAPIAIQQNFQQYWTTNNMTGANSPWSMKDKYTMVLTPGDEANCHFECSMLTTTDPSEYSYRKGCFHLIARVQGALVIATTDASLANFGPASVAYYYKKKTSIFTRDGLYTQQHRISNPVVGAVTAATAQVAGDGEAAAAVV